jgi:hypothetical protein
MTDRLETGVFQPEGDWPGVFIRGDNALSYAHQLKAAYLMAEKRAESGAMDGSEAMIWSSLKTLADLFESCRAR